MPVTIRARVVRLTEQAALLRVDEEQEWVPLSCIDDGDALEVGDEAEDINIRTWKARELGWDA